jgi:hypothetical protein
MKRTDPLWVKCDDLCREIVRLRDGKCRFCGNPGASSHHIISRNHLGTAHMPENCLWLCQRCHNHDINLQAKCIELIGQAEFDRLWEIANKVTQLRYADLILIRGKLRKERDEIQS